MYKRLGDKQVMVGEDQALPGRAEAMAIEPNHFVNGNRIVPPFPEGCERAIFGMGCFWGRSVASGCSRGSTPLRSVMRRVTPPTPPMRRSAAARAVTTRWCWWSTILCRLVMRGCWRRSGPHITQPRGCARVTISVPSTAPASTILPIPSARRRSSRSCTTSTP